MEKELPALKGFILPGGNMTAAWAHVARTVCRRAERRVVRLLDGSEGGKSGGQLLNITAYLNRLSDYLFVLARYCNRLAQVPDYLWK
jgi:cob(I)alamin adenosyltransferase